MAGAARFAGAVSSLGCSLILLLTGLEAQTGPALYLDADLQAGYQGANVVRALAPGDQVVLELVGKSISGADGFSMVLNFDPAVLAFSSFEAGAAIPGFSGLTLSGGSGKVEVGGASLSGRAGEGAVKLGTVTFTVTGMIGSSGITIGATMLTVSASQVTVNETAGVSLIGTPASIMLDGNAAAGQQGATLIDDVVGGQVVEVEILGSDLTGITGFAATLTYSSGLVYDGFTAGTAIPGISGLQLKSTGEVEIGGASVSGSATVSSGRLGVARFLVAAAFDGEATITLSGGSFARPTGETDLVLAGTVRVRGTAVGSSADFDGSGLVDFSDFLAFASGFGKSLGDAGYDPALDLDKDGEVGFTDFLAFAGVFGTPG
jgi:hypothetical protein